MQSFWGFKMGRTLSAKTNNVFFITLASLFGTTTA
jgi:hypothetical protein